MSGDRSATLEKQFERAFDGICERAGLTTLPVVAVAYSGGLDSTVLLRLTHAYAACHGLAIHAFHVHHGLSPNADRWLEHCRSTCAALGVAFAGERVSVQEGGGIEEAARLARYAALGTLCRQYEVPLLLTAHHQDDQAETVLMQLLRGSGLPGLAGMESVGRAPDLLHAAAATGRPLLDVSRQELEDYARLHGLAWVEDESNCDERFTRNALRRRVMPELEAWLPGYRHRIARTARHVQSAERLLAALAEGDFSACSVGAALDLNGLRKLDADRADNLLRYWLASHGMRMPTSAWLDEMRVQLLVAREDAQICVTHAGGVIRRHRGLAFITPRREAPDCPSQAFVWRGESALHFPSHGGSLIFDAAETGLAATWLAGRDCTLHHRMGGERLRLAPNRPSRDLKHHYQTMNIPAWERPYLPLVSCAGELLFAAGLGMDSAYVGSGEGRICLRWQADGDK